MIMAPDWINQHMFATALARVEAKKQPARLGDIRLESLTEGSCVQTLHVGPFDEEGDVLARMHHRFIPDKGFRMVGKHHEIYFSDPRKAVPEKLRTILRQPVRSSAAQHE